MAALVSKQIGLVRGRVARFTLVDQCGMPQITNSMYVTDGFVMIKQTKNMDMGTEIKVRGADGTIKEYEPGRATLTHFATEIQFIKIDPAAIVMLSGDPLVLDYAGAATGWEEKALVKLTQNFALEVWTSTSGAPCSANSPYSGYMLYPMIGQSYVEFDDITEKEVTGWIKGMSYGNPSWGRGPYGNSPTDGSSVPGPIATAAGPPPTPGRLIVAVDPAAHRHFELTQVPAPAAFTTPGPISITLPTSY
jgi:hypothetical protein